MSEPTDGSAAPISPNVLFGDDPHRRLNILTGEWVLVSPHRMKRPWQGQLEEIPPDDRPAYDPKCYLCPGNERAGDIAIRSTPVRGRSRTTSPHSVRATRGRS